MRCAPVLVALTLLAAACSSAPPVGQVGATLAAMDGSVTLDKVLSPAPVAHGSLGPAYGHKLVAVVLTVHSPTSSPAKFAGIYNASKLIDSKKLVHVGRSTAKYKVTDCVAYPPFASLGAGRAATGCVVFVLNTIATPVELKISGKSEAAWTITAAAVRPGSTPVAIGKLPTATVPRAAVPLPTTTLPGAPTTTAVPGNGAGAGTTSTAAPAGAGSTTPTTLKPSLAVSTPHARHHGAAGTPRIVRVTPRGAPVGARVSIWGRKLAGATRVTFNGVAAVVQKDVVGRIVAIVPEGATKGPVVVSTPSGTATSPRMFIVL